MIDMKKFILFMIFLVSCVSLNAQVTTYFYGNDPIQSSSGKYSAALYAVKIYESTTRVQIELKVLKNHSRLNYWTSQNTVLILPDGRELPIIGFEKTRNGESVVDTAPFSGNWGWDKVKAGEKYYYTMVFAGKIPPGVTNFTLKDKGTYNGAHGFGWSNYTLNNPHTGGTSWNETTVKQNINENNDGICGIYEGDKSSNSLGYRLACIKVNGEYRLIYLSSMEKKSWWVAGDTKAILRSSATNGFFKADWIMADKTTNSNCYVVFDGGSMKTVIDGDENFYLKMYPSSSNTGIGSSAAQEWSGSGFALNNGYIATNYHVVENAKTITVQGIKGSFSTEYKATVIATDKFNDLALIKISDSRFSGFGTIPYRVKTSTAEVGEDVFVLGYPLTSTMGDEIKLTTGVVSSKTGFQGDVSLYQISAPIQPGNSGGPLFDGNGNLIGIVNAKHKGAENVGYAIKASYLNNLVESAASSSILPSTNTVSGQPLTGKVKNLKNFVFMIKCSSSGTGSSTSTSTVSSSYNSNSSTRTVTNPKVNTNYANKLNVQSVTLSSTETVLTISDNNMSSNGSTYYEWMNLDAGAYIVANGQKYQLKRAEGIAIAPNKTYFSYAGETKTFKLYFPSIPTSTTSIDFIESSTSEWKLYGIQLR